MRHFHHLDRAERDRLFYRDPEVFDRSSPAEILAVALGATLYMPATRPTIADDLVRLGGRGVTSSVVCLEDAIADADLAAAQVNAVEQLRAFEQRVTDLATSMDGQVGPMVFVRVRHPEQIPAVMSGLGPHAGVLSGFVLPKFTDSNGAAFLDALVDTAAVTGRNLLAMPVLESAEVIHQETRQETLLGIQQLLDKHRDSVLAVRIGATDLSSAYGIRRDRNLTIYDVRLVAEVITDVVNILGRADGGYVVTGPVWEYFHATERLFKPQLRASPFEEHDARTLRHELITRDLDGLLREVVLDKANGLTGKTVIHPSHVAAVHALSVVTHEEFTDASDILGEGPRNGGAAASSYRNKMNESKPHRAWAERTLRRAAVFGVAAHDVSFVDLIAAGTPA